MAKSKEIPKSKQVANVIVGLALLGILIVVLVSCLTGGESDKTNASDMPVSEESPTQDLEITVLDMSTDGNKFVSAEFPVADSAAKNGIIMNLHDGCVQAIQEAKAQIPEWESYNVVQCMGMSAWGDTSVFVGSANFSGTQLAAVSDVEMTDDAKAFWSLAEQSSISDHL